MTIESAFYTLLTRCGALAGVTIAPGILDATATYPAISFGVVSMVVDQTLRGPSGINQTRMQVDVWSKVHKEATTLRDALRRHLDGFQGNVEGLDIQEVRFENAVTQFEASNQLYHLSLDFKVGFAEGFGSDN